MSELYDDDILLWSERQGDLLRRIAAGEPVNERPDWVNIIEEVESVGRSDLRAVESLLLQALMHMLKAEAWPNSLSVPRGSLTPCCSAPRRDEHSVHRCVSNIDLASIYADALQALPDTMDGQPPQPVSPTCPMTLDELLG